MKTSVIVVDGHASVRQLLAAQLEHGGFCKVVGEAKTGFEALQVCRERTPAVVVLELLLPEMDGLELLRQLRRQDPKIRTLIYSGAQDAALTLEALHERPHGFVHKSDSLAILLEAFQAVARGCTYFTPFATDILAVARGKSSPSAPLSGRERVVLQMVAEGLSNKEMAQRMQLSPKTVEYHRSRLITKLGMHDVAKLTRYAMRIGLITRDG